MLAEQPVEMFLRIAEMHFVMQVVVRPNAGVDHRRLGRLGWGSGLGADGRERYPDDY